ncbi:hypothetical protein SAMN05421736_12569 [Evansella caseinilytica]|uniref:ATP-binding protein n=1 Tax=Evansella caseinilytica TaxID=1503961 RepID=A0A1H3USN5_9BACI|nr:hypothetical protein [Evansella caseinilytica]SDZ65470.1 hypothetical protein SAMN05421736_12569 [Evansella caseinilytica]
MNSTNSKRIEEFNEITIYKLFGHEAAEDENPVRLKEYYFKNETYQQITANLPLRILVGHKGIGKSALIKVAIQEDKESNRISVLVKPDDIVGLGATPDDFLKVIRDWKEGLSEIITRKILQSTGTYNANFTQRLKEYGGMIVDFLSDTFSSKLEDIDLNPTKKLLLNTYLKNNIINIYIDDLDRGWQGRKEDISRISALLNAVRDLSTENSGLCFKISLRADVYYLVRTSDESTDKIEGSVIWQVWDNHEILVMLVKRIETYFGNEIKNIDRNQAELSKLLEPILHPFFKGEGHWKNAPTYKVIMSLIRKRPRDIIKLCTLAARAAKKDNKNRINTHHLESVFQEYSQGRLQDTINEYRSEVPDIERLLINMKPSKKEKLAKLAYVYSTDELLRKIRNIQQSGAFNLANGREATTKEIAAFLYKINFLTARKVLEDGKIDRKYFEENRYLSNEFSEFGYHWEVHPAYRWVLQPDNNKDIYLQLQI